MERHEEKWIVFDDKGQPRSMLFDDKYFCEEDGLLESRHIFCAGNDLTMRWQEMPADKSTVFTIGETGFGTGLNLLCAWQLWDKYAPSKAALHYISVEQHPLLAADINKALNMWPELTDYARALTECYPLSQQVPAVHTMRFPRSRLTVTLLFDHVNSALDQMGELTNNAVDYVDAWFLDGFAPAKNPDMWSQTLFNAIARLSRSGSTVSTFTVAGTVRRGLAYSGFTITKAAGFGRKRHMLKGYFAG